MRESITLTDSTQLRRGDMCLAGHPVTLRFRLVTILDLIEGSGVERALVKDERGEKWIVSRYGLRGRR